MAVGNNLDDAKLLTLNSVPPLVDRHEDVHASQRRHQERAERKPKWLKIDFKFCQGAMKKTQKHNSSHGVPGENKTVPLKI